MNSINLSQSETASATELAESYRLDISQKLVPKKRSEMGQFLTSVSIARFMASLFDSVECGQIRLLDAGAGVGSLTAAFVEELCSRTTHPQEIYIKAYELEPTMIEYLQSTLTNCRRLCRDNGIDLQEKIEVEDFIVGGAKQLANDLFQCPPAKESFTHVIMNPPYKKIRSNSPHRKWLQAVGVEISNLYAGFLTIAIEMLRPGGELVAIVPRSFCNGPYFKSFRRFLLEQMTIKRFHVFESRAHAFKDDEVLQENIIFHAVKGAALGTVRITSSHSVEFSKEYGEMIVEDMTQRTASYTSVVKPDDPEQFIHIATTDFEQHVVDRISVFNYTLEDLGIEVSTGPLVDFRLKEHLRQKPGPGTAPLLYPAHFDADGLTWPKSGKKPNAINITPDSEKWLWSNNGHYVVTKRFTAKEERRRIVAAIYDSSLPARKVGFENHLNVFHRQKQGLSKEIALGLAVYLNCTLVDKYFRQFNGHTQVNSADLRTIHYPSLETLAKFGSLAKGKIPLQKDIDYLINQEISRMGKESMIDPIQAQQKIDEALNLLINFGLPRGQQNERSALTLLAILNLKPDGSWQELEQPLMGITPIMEFCRAFYGKEYAPNTRETFRRQTMHQFVEAGIALYNPDEPDRPVNSPKACYQISPETFAVILTYGTDQWDQTLSSYLEERETLAQLYEMQRKMQMIPVEVEENYEIALTPGTHSKLIKDIIVEFAPRYAPGSEVIYVGDTGSKIGYLQQSRLLELGVEVNEHGKMPDVVLYYQEKNWLFLIEAVTTHGPVDSKRHRELSTLFSKAVPGLVYVTAFPDRTTMGKYITEISWETEVWVAETPTHIIHFDGNRFLGPYETS